jgi:hypothetical protein
MAVSISINPWSFVMLGKTTAWLEAGVLRLTEKSKTVC